MHEKKFALKFFLYIFYEFLHQFLAKFKQILLLIITFRLYFSDKNIGEINSLLLVLDYSFCAKHHV